ncbi:MAG: sigma-70 family RNA polymerase sigma factor [Candidatus Peribacteraceae bacterium]
MPPDPTSLIEEAYTQYADAIFRHIYLRLRDRERAKELMQEAFIKAMNALKKNAEIQNLRAFLYTISNNLIIDDVRKKKSLSLDELQESGFEPTGASETSLHTVMEGHRVAEVLGKLREEDRDLIVMRFVDNMKPQEIAEILGIAPNTISVRIHRALKELKSHLRSE